jgi:hypothetical protein
MAGNENETDMSMNSGGSYSDKVAATIADLEEAIMIVEEEMTPYLGRKLSWERLNAMVARVEELRKTLRKGHLFLVKEKAPEYTTELRDIVAVHKRVLTDLMISFSRDWDEKTKRAANRGLLKVPKFTDKSDTLTIFEFEKEFIIYKKAAALLVSESLTQLKEAKASLPRNSNVNDTKTEAQTFRYRS